MQSTVEFQQNLYKKEAKMDNSITINKFLPIAIIYFFFNSFLLPGGLLYTTLLTPLLLLWIIKYPTFNYLSVFFLVSLPFVVIHLLNGVNILAYLKSYLLLISVFVFGLCFYQFLKECKHLPKIFRSLIIINLFFVIIALISLFIPLLKSTFWYVTEFTSGVNRIARLRMLTYEPSYYSILFVPVVLYYYLKIVLLKLPNAIFIFLLLTIPLLLSLSFGIILGIILAMAILFLSDIKLFTLRRKFPAKFIFGILIFLLLFTIILQLFPNNPLFIRIGNIFAGKDVSFRGRTFDSFYLAWKIAAEKSILFGSGPGQTKLIGLDFFKEFYNYTNFTVDEIGIPNSVGDTLATFGILGVLIRLSVQVYFFFKTNVYSNFYRLSIFIFVFIYQFTGSFITNIAEYVLWILAFYPALFPEFDKKNVYEFNRKAITNLRS
jgi:hypothetical protein